MTETKVSDREYRDRATALANMLTLRPERHNQRTFGAVKPQNECGTVACIAGWAGMAKAGLVTIALDGQMTWDHKVPFVFYDGKGSRHEVGTLYDRAVVRSAEDAGREWLGLSLNAASTLFFTFDETVVIEVLRRVGAGSLSRDFSAHDIWAVEAELAGAGE